MNYKSIKIDISDKKNIKKFLSLPQKLYNKDEITQDKQTEKKLIYGNHILSSYFTVYPFITIDGNGIAVSRCTLTVYPDSKCGYIGFLESINDFNAFNSVLKKAEQWASSLELESLTGPVDCSFWIKYRLKTNQFHIPYFGEPYNKSYYEKFFIKYGWDISGEYISNRFSVVPLQYQNKIFSERLEKFKENGYNIISPDKNNFETALNEIYSMIIRLYSDFQTFSHITYDEFSTLYSSMKQIVNYNMIKIAYFDNKAVGFFVSVPDIKNYANGRLILKNLVKILKIKKNCKDYVMLYMGAEPEHRGLGKALAESIKCELANNGAKSTGALIRKGKINSGYFSELTEYQYEYKLYSKNIQERGLN